MGNSLGESQPDVERALDQASALVGGASHLALACHVSPDGDALGSMLALHHLAIAAGMPSVASWPEPFLAAPHYQFLPGLDLATKPADFPADPEVMVTFDCGSLQRLCELGAVAARCGDRGGLVVLDHHASNDGYGSINVIDHGAAATAVVVRRLAARLGWPLTRDAAICLYTGLVTDTGRFQHNNTTPSVFALAEELASFDLPISEMSRKLFEEHRFAYLQLMATCVARAQLDTDLGLVSTSVGEGDLQHFDVTLEETEGLIDIIRRSAEAEVACVLKEAPEGVRVSLRSLSRVDVGAIACALGGGGHRFAAGFTGQGSVEEVLDSVRAAVSAASQGGAGETAAVG